MPREQSGIDDLETHRSPARALGVLAPDCHELRRLLSDCVPGRDSDIVLEALHYVEPTHIRQHDIQMVDSPYR